MSSKPSLARKTDRRISRTRRQLRDALFALILEKGFDAVTIEEITNRADLGRTTFYLHYRDKEDLLMESISELADDLVEQMARLPPETWKFDNNATHPAPSPAIVLPFRHVANHAQLYRIILRGEGSYTISRRLREIIVQTCAAMLGVLFPNDQLAALKPQVPMEVFLHYVAGSWLGLITWWLEHDMPYNEVEMALMFQKLIRLGAAEVLGIAAER